MLPTSARLNSILSQLGVEATLLNHLLHLDRSDMQRQTTRWVNDVVEPLLFGCFVNAHSSSPFPAIACATRRASHARVARMIKLTTGACQAISQSTTPTTPARVTCFQVISYHSRSSTTSGSELPVASRSRCTQLTCQRACYRLDIASQAPSYYFVNLLCCQPSAATGRPSAQSGSWQSRSHSI